METTFDYLRAHAAELGARILETYPPLQSTKDQVAPAVATLLRKALGLAITATAKYLRQAKAARIVAECGAGKTFMALGIRAKPGRPSRNRSLTPWAAPATGSTSATTLRVGSMFSASR